MFPDEQYFLILHGGNMITALSFTLFKLFRLSFKLELYLSLFL